MKRWDKTLVALCPRCGQHIEDDTHILKCQDTGAVETWDASVGKVQAWMDANSTCPDLAQLVHSLLINFKSGRAVELHDDILYDGVKRVFEAQCRIGWRLMLDGCLTGEWAECQQRYLVWIGSRKSGKKMGGGVNMQIMGGGMGRMDA